MDLWDLNSIKTVLLRYGFSFSKNFGQNFLIDKHVPELMAKASGVDKDTSAFEVGPGIGVLTAELAKLSCSVLCLELDARLIPVLNETLSGCENVHIHKGDLLKTDLAALIRDTLPNKPVVACASLPYNITTPAIRALIQSGVFKRITVMVQKEAAIRLCSKPGISDYGEFSVFVQYNTKPEILFDVPAGCFYPRPKVDSSVVSMDVYVNKPVVPLNENLFYRIVHASFAQRRKTLLNSLSSFFNGQFTKADIQNALLSCNIDETRRGETLSVHEYAKISDCLSAIKDG